MYYANISLKSELLKEFQKCYRICIFKIVKGMILFMTLMTRLCRFPAQDVMV